MIPIDFQVTCSKVKIKPLFSAHCVVRSISFDPFTWSIPYLVQGLRQISRWSLLIFRSHVQRSRSNHSLSQVCCQLILIPCLLASDRCYFYREDKHEFCTGGGGIYVSETFLVEFEVISNSYKTCINLHWCSWIYFLHSHTDVFLWWSAKIRNLLQSYISSDSSESNETFSILQKAKRTPCDVPGCVAGASKIQTKYKNIPFKFIIVRVAMVMCYLKWTHVCFQFGNFLFDESIRAEGAVC